jgi:uncharacterized protein YggE
MGVEITVRGAAEARYAAERALVRMEAAVEGLDREDVRDRVAAVHGPLLSHLADLQDAGAVTTWSSDQVHVHSRREVLDGGRVGVATDRAVHAARAQVTAEFVDFERLSGFVDQWSGREGVDVHGLEWDLATRSRRTFEAEVRRQAVDDAVAKAQAYADAVRRGRVVAIEIADPGMLGRGGDAPFVEHRARSVAAHDAAGSIDLVPGEIVVTAQVDARFVAE